MNIIKNIKTTAINVLLNEAEALRNLQHFIDDAFENCVKEILFCEGRLVITGIGKSAIIAQKIVATLNSTGTPSLFMHAADAIHGDLGMIQSNDMVMCISKSGNTPEVKVLVPLLKRRGAKLIALVSNHESYLAKQADFVLFAPVSEEACPNNLAPTSSTTAHMAIGDALAVCLLEQRNFSPEDFAQYHPGGALGKQLYLKVDDIYIQHELPLVKKSAGLSDIIMEISAKRLGATAVWDGGDDEIGIITDGDLRRLMQEGLHLGDIKAGQIVSKAAKTIKKGSFAVKALQIMQSENITQLIVTDEKKPVGFVHLHDLLKEGIV